MPRSRTLVLTVAILMASAGVAAAASAPSPSALLKSAFSNALKRGSVHYVSTVVAAKEHITFTADITSTSGRQSVADSGGQRVVEILLDHVAYVSGNASGLVKYLGLSSKAAGTVGSRWVAIPSSSSYYASVADGVTLPSELADITPSGALKRLPESEVGSTKVIGVQGRPEDAVGLAGTLTTYVTAAAALPIKVVMAITTAGHVQNGVLTLSHWGEHVTVAKPAHIVSISSLSITRL